MMLACIAAVSQNNCIGKDNTLPWHIPEDLARFKTLTQGKIVLMGRKTWESLPAAFRPLPGRLNIVITRQVDYPLPAGVERFNDPETALATHSTEEIFVIGGEQLFRELVPKADVLYITHVHAIIENGTAFFPELDLTRWHEAAREDHPGFSFVTYK